jgi:hypothetical protein
VKEKDDNRLKENRKWEKNKAERRIRKSKTSKVKEVKI